MDKRNDKARWIVVIRLEQPTIAAVIAAVVAGALRALFNYLF